MPRHLVAVGVVISAICCSTSAVPGAQPPVPLMIGERMIIVRLPDGSLMGSFIRGMDGVQEVAARYSTDNGYTWSEPQTLLKLPKQGGTWGGPEVLVDREGEVHLFFLKWDKVGTELPGEDEGVIEGYLGGHSGNWLNIWHTKSTDGRTKWRAPKLVWKGYTGALNSVIQMSNGRILLPFSCTTPRSWSKRGPGVDEFTYTGYFDSTLIYSDDAGDTWHPADSLSVPTPNIGTYGAIEPVVLQLKDGRVWMLIRTQMGRFWESFSDDGARWSRPGPSNIISSDSPAGLVRLDDGRIVLLWNCCQRFPYAYGGRHVLHAAVSDDEGKTWRGYREVARDPKRNEPPPARGDFGTAYPFPTAVNDGKVIFCTGQGEGRVQLLLLDPDWLLETSQTADFVNRQDEWSTFGTKGVEFIAHPDKPDAKVLRIRKTSKNWPACAVWNFPAGREGRLRVRLMLNRRFKGALLGLTDHFSAPFDMEDRFYNLFNLELAPDGTFLEGAKLRPGRWHELLLEWSHAKRTCTVSVDGEHAGVLPLLHETARVCYLRLRSTAEAIDRGGFMVESVEAEITKP